MSSRTSHQPSQSCSGSEFASVDSFDDIVDDYIQSYRPHDEEERKNWINRACLGDAVRAAALSTLLNGKRHPHQYRIPGEALQRAREALVEIDFSAFRSFEELHESIERSIKSPAIKGIGELTVYDIAHRIGMFLDIAPEFVYLHSGTRDGARALGLTGDKLQFDQLPSAFQRLTPAEIENCLCIYKANIRQLGNPR